MVKRKRDALPAVIQMQPVEDATGTTVGPFAVYFPSGFNPSSDASCTWHVYTHKQHKHQHVIVARTVSFARNYALAEHSFDSPVTNQRLTMLGDIRRIR